MIILGIETSCDETSVGIVDDELAIRANVIASQIDLHSRTGGVVPEVAARKHVESIIWTLEEALYSASLRLGDVTAVAVTSTHGLLGCLSVGVSFAKALSYSLQIPLIGVHHIVGHIYAPILAAKRLPFPHLCLTASGGHTCLVRVNGHHSYQILGDTLDDAAGEAFDKAARVLGLPFPGGPIIDNLSRNGDAKAFLFPRPLMRSKSRHFSFSGLKTDFLRRVRQMGDVEPHLHDLAASFQEAVIETLVRKTTDAALDERIDTITLAGGVAANSRLRIMMSEVAERRRLTVLAPPRSLCTDNGAMVAAAGLFRLRDGLVSGLDLDAQASGQLI